MKALTASQQLIVSLTDDHAAKYLVAVDRKKYIQEAILKPANLENMHVEIIEHVLTAKLSKLGIDPESTTQASRNAAAYTGY